MLLVYALFSRAKKALLLSFASILFHGQGVGFASPGAENTGQDISYPLPLCGLKALASVPESQKSFLLEEIFSQVHRRFPGQPDARAKELISQLTAQGFNASQVVAMNSHLEPTYRKRLYHRFRSVASARADTLFTIPKIIDREAAQFGLIYLHGLGLDYSNMGSTYAFNNLILEIQANLRGEKSDKYSKYLVKRMSSVGALRGIIPMAADVPGSGTGISPNSIETQKDAVDYFDVLLEEAAAILKAETGRDIPLVVVARSASGPLVSKLHFDVQNT